MDLPQHHTMSYVFRGLSSNCVHSPRLLLILLNVLLFYLYYSLTTYTLTIPVSTILRPTLCATLDSSPHLTLGCTFPFPSSLLPTCLVHFSAHSTTYSHTPPPVQPALPNATTCCTAHYLQLPHATGTCSACSCSLLTLPILVLHTLPYLPTTPYSIH